MKKDKESIKRLGKAIADFANAETTEKATSRHLENIQCILSFSPSCMEKAIEVFRLLRFFDTHMDPYEKKLIDLLRYENKCITSINVHCSVVGNELLGYDHKKKTFNISTCPLEASINSDNKIISNIHTEPYQITLKKFKEYISQWEFFDYGNEFNDKLLMRPKYAVDGLMEVGPRIAKIMPKVKKSQREAFLRLVKRYNELLKLHEDIKKKQSVLRDILEGFIKGDKLNQIDLLQQFIDNYNKLSKSLVYIDDENELIDIPPFSEMDYLEIGVDDQIDWLIQRDLSYCLIEFLKAEGNRIRKLVHKCDECGKYIISVRAAKQRFCPGNKCRLAYHNRERIKSGKAREYKRRKRREGAKESYYG